MKPLLLLTLALFLFAGCTKKTTKVIYVTQDCQDTCKTKCDKYDDHKGGK